MNSLRPVDSYLTEEMARRSGHAKQVICDQVRHVLADRFATSLRAIVLTGSLARDEATFVPGASGVKLLGDADFFIVFQDRSPLPPASLALARVKEAEANVRAAGVEASISFAMVYGGYLERLPRHISAYELRSNGLVIWGEQEILSLVPSFGAAAISLEDAWRLLANRLIEQFEMMSAERYQSDKRHELLQYRAAKLYLDMATSYLVFTGNYRPTYHAREEALRLASGSASAASSAPFSLVDFASRVSECTRFKMSGAPMACSAQELIESALFHSRLLWVWELQHLSRRPDVSDPAELMALWMARQTMRARIRGLASLVRRTGWRERAHYGIRWLRLSRRASPRYWVYRGAAELLFGLGESSQAGANETATFARDCKRMGQLLPVTDPDSLSERPAAWRSLARALASNYHRFLESTSA